MVILRPTRKLQTLLPVAKVGQAVSDTALGDWYVNRVVVKRHPLLILVSSASVLPILVPARDVRTLPARLSDIVEARLARVGDSVSTIGAEEEAMTTVLIEPTVDRSVVGIMVEFVRALPYHPAVGQFDETRLPSVEDWLAETPCHAGGRDVDVVFPDRKAPELLRRKWAG
jgi:hypothetical protein